MQLEAAEVRSSETDHAASHLGKAIGIAAILRGTARHAAKYALVIISKKHFHCC